MTLAAHEKKARMRAPEKGGLREIGNRRHSPCMCRQLEAARGAVLPGPEMDTLKYKVVA